MAATRHTDLSIIIVSYNTKAMTLACLDSVIAETRNHDYEIIVVDNASSDGSAEAIAAHPAAVRLIALDENIGFARANNLAAADARGGYILLLNPDTVVLDGAIDRLLRFAYCCPHARIWGGRTVNADGTPNPASCWGRMTVWNLFCRASGLTGLFAGTTLFNGEAMGGYARDCVRQVDIVSGCFLLIEQSTWLKLAGFDPLFHMYGEEADLCLRARALGATPLVTPTAAIVHYGGASERVRSDKMVRLLTSKATLIRRYFSPGAREAGLLLNAAWPLTRLLVLAVASLATGSPALREKARSWQQVWNRRNEWRAGYAPARRAGEPTRRVLGRLAATTG